MSASIYIPKKLLTIFYTQHPIPLSYRKQCTVKSQGPDQYQLEIKTRNHARNARLCVKGWVILQWEIYRSITFYKNSVSVNLRLPPIAKDASNMENCADLVWSNVKTRAHLECPTRVLDLTSITTLKRYSSRRNSRTPISVRRAVAQWIRLAPLEVVGYILWMHPIWSLDTPPGYDHYPRPQIQVLAFYHLPAWM